MIDYLFYLCVDILVWIANFTGTSYEFVNIVIFVVGYPLFAIALLLIIYFQYKKIKKIEHKVVPSVLEAHRKSKEISNLQQG